MGRFRISLFVPSSKFPCHIPDDYHNYNYNEHYDYTSVRIERR